ncbi:MAG: NADPH-dependent F420 reductase [Solirubrobacterales bacterium]
MNIGVLGTGMVGKGLASKLVLIGHDVKMGSRKAGNESAVGWAEDSGERASEGTFAAAAAHGEIVLNATLGSHSIEALEAAGEENLNGKLLIDVANPIDRDTGTLTVANTDSLGEQIQARFPDAHVVKTLNTIFVGMMVNPAAIKGSHNLFLSGNDGNAKRETRRLLEAMGWSGEDIVDLGDISTARGPEMYLIFFLKVAAALDNFEFNVEVKQAG